MLLNDFVSLIIKHIYVFLKIHLAMNVPIVTLTTDWGDRDHYVAMVKGRLYSSIPDVRVVDLSHSQDWDSVAVAAKIIQYGCLSFPAGTVHIIDFCEDLAKRNSAPKIYRPVPLLAEFNGHYFLCCNRRLLEASLNADCDSIVNLPMPEIGSSDADTFLAYSLFCDVAAMIVRGAKLSDIGEPAAPLVHRSFLRAQFDGNVISARPDVIDHYGNVTLNLKYSDFKEYCAGRKFRLELEFQVGAVEQFQYVTMVARHYGHEIQGNLVLTVSSTGYLQLAMNRGSAAELIGINYSTVCRFVLGS